MLNWWYAHNLFGLWLTPMLIALTYYIVPRITNTPLYSYSLSLVSFWGMAFFYTGVGDHHLLQTPTPAWLKTIATLSSISLLIPVFAFTINILGTMKGNWEKFFTNLPLRFTMTAFVFYFLTNIQGAFQAVQPFNQMTHFTNFVVAHAHLALLGGFTILGMGVIDYCVAQIYRRPLWSRTLSEWQYWLVTIGFTGFFSALTMAGFIQGQSWSAGIPEVNVLPLLHPWFIARAVFGAMIVLSGIIQMVNIFMTVRGDTAPRLARGVDRVSGRPAVAGPPRST
jgi:cbb3-type cytochrome c oxidase subunit I